MIGALRFLFLMPEPIPALGVCVKVALLLALAWGLTAYMRRRTAAARHSVWAAALVGSLALAVSTPFTPRVPVYVPVTFTREAGDVPADAPLLRASPPTPAPHTAPTPGELMLGLEIVSTLWLAGAVGVGGWLLSGHVALARIVRRARSRRTRAVAPWLARALASERGATGVPRQRASRVLVSDDIAVPLTWGVLRPIVLMPSRAASWPAARVRAAWLHERAHVERRDCLIQAAASLACVTFWFLPLAWLAVRRMRAESERACDDRVLAAGLAAPDYAGHLLEVARERWSVPAALAAAGMARGWEFERRVAAILDERRAHAGLNARAAIAVFVIAVSVLAPLSVLRLRIAPRWVAPNGAIVTESSTRR